MKLALNDRASGAHKSEYTTKHANNECCANLCEEEKKGEGQINLFGEIKPDKKKEEKKELGKKTKSVTSSRLQEASDKDFEAEEKFWIIYSTHKIEIQPEDALADKKTIWQKYLRQFPEFEHENSFNYISFCLGTDGIKGNVYFKVGPKG